MLKQANGLLFTGGHPHELAISNADAAGRSINLHANAQSINQMQPRKREKAPNADRFAQATPFGSLAICARTDDIAWKG